MTLDTGELPRSWKHSRVSPPFKGKKPDQPAGYRPVAITSHISRSAERMILNRITDHLHDALHAGQHGYRKGRGCDTALEHIIGFARAEAKRTTRLPSMNASATRKTVGTAAREKMTSYVHKQLITAIDFTDAFTRVSHASVSLHMHRLGLDDHVRRWVMDWLQDRTFAVK